MVARCLCQCILGARPLACALPPSLRPYSSWPSWAASPVPSSPIASALGRALRPPSILAPGSPDGLTETLVELTLPAELRPGGDQFLAVFRSVTAAADSRTAWLANPCCAGPQVIYVLAGSYTAQAMNGPLTVHRAAFPRPNPSKEDQCDPEPRRSGRVGPATNQTAHGKSHVSPVRLLTWQLTAESTFGALTTDRYPDRMDDGGECLPV